LIVTGVQTCALPIFAGGVGNRYAVRYNDEARQRSAPRWTLAQRSAPVAPQAKNAERVSSDAPRSCNSGISAWDTKSVVHGTWFGIPAFHSRPTEALSAVSLRTPTTLRKHEGTRATHCMPEHHQHYLTSCG